MPASHRVFFALWPDAGVARLFDEAGRKGQEALGGRRMRRETLHLTLAFIGDVAPGRLEELRDMAAAIRLPAFDQRFDRLQCLPRKKLFWAAASAISPALRDLAAVLDARLKAADFRTEDRPFAAHVTLLRNACCKKLPPNESVRIEWPVRDFVLAESAPKPTGAAYRIIGRWELSADNRLQT